MLGVRTFKQSDEPTNDYDNIFTRLGEIIDRMIRLGLALEFVFDNQDNIDNTTDERIMQLISEGDNLREFYGYDFDVEKIKTCLTMICYITKLSSSNTRFLE